MDSNKFVFRLQPNVTKIEIKNLIEKIYGVKILKVNTLNYEGRVKRAPRPRKWYRTNRYKKAIVTVDESIEVNQFAAPSEFIDSEVITPPK
jgi:large subunit ribosomal protein L23